MAGGAAGKCGSICKSSCRAGGVVRWSRKLLGSCQEMAPGAVECVAVEAHAGGHLCWGGTGGAATAFGRRKDTTTGQRQAPS